jgi:predicted component of type VI protein secretion system
MFQKDKVSFPKISQQQQRS